MKFLHPFIATMLAMGMAAFTVTSSAQQTNEPRIPSVTATTVEESWMIDRVPVSGTLVAREEVLVNSTLSGYEIREILVDIGDRVAAGDVLLRLDTSNLEALLAQSDADMIRANASVRQAQSQIDSARASLTQAESVLKRNQQLRESGNVPDSALDETRSNADSARAGFASAQDGLIVAQAQLAQISAQRDITVLNLERAEVKSTVDGLVVERTARLGAITAAGGEPLFRIVANGEVELEAEVVETALPRVKTGNAVTVSIPGNGEITGRVRLVPVQVDERTRLGTVRVSLQGDKPLTVGSFADGWIIVDERQSLVIPNSAIQSTPEGSYATVVSDGEIEKRAIRAGILYQGNREVLQGLDAGEQVLIRSGGFFRTGDKVRVVSENTGQQEESQ